ncbi:hypothetical protein [Kiloniella sp.]|uniref:hypothetical protein n=1 Tax=Kiloniella sp. TaxID=1938587 RepID=UPI003A93EF9B
MPTHTVIFSNQTSKNKTAYYDFDETIFNHPNLLDLRSIIKVHRDKWLEELNLSHSTLGEEIAANDKSWWFSRLSRLDVRPWGNADIFKPLIFSHAMITWLNSQTEGQTLHINGAPFEVYTHLKSVAKTMAITIHHNFSTKEKKYAGNRGQHKLLPTLKRIWSLFRLARSRPAAKYSNTSNFIIYQHIHNQNLQDGYKYYYTNLFDELDQNNISILALGLTPDNKDGRTVSLLRQLNYTDVVIATLAGIRSYLSTRKLRGSPCQLDSFNYPKFWSQYFAQLNDPEELIEVQATYRMIKRLLKSRKNSRVILPYEEKGIERAVLLAALENGVETIGFTPHPQHKLLLALKDQDQGTCPKPITYAYCGEGYSNYFKEWGNKVNAQGLVWGSRKSPSVSNWQPRYSSQKKLKVLFTVSHPEEIRIFRSWLLSTPEICEISDINLRRYKAVDDTFFDLAFADLQERYPNISEVSGDLGDNVKANDIVLFCATSAGPEAINFGILGIYADLTDCFSINPVFDNIEPFLPVETSKDFLDLLTKLTQMSQQERDDIYKTQRDWAKFCFAPINQNLLKKVFA